MLVVNIAEESIRVGDASLWQNVLAYGALLTVIASQNLLLKRRALLKLVNIQILFLLICQLFFLNFLPHASHTLLSFAVLAEYFLAIFLFHLTNKWKQFRHAFNQVHFLVPFVVPFLLFQILADLFQPFDGAVSSLLVTLGLIGGLIVFLPFLVKTLWRCQPIPEGPLKDRLEAFSQRAGFRHGGMHVWTVMQTSMTAAIIGVVPRFRYVMFTESLLRTLPEEEVEAILAHEIGHSHHKHLLIYPFVITGMLLVAGVVSWVLYQPLSDLLGLAGMLAPSQIWEGALPLVVFLPYALSAALYFRYIFGLFSRSFERQADIYPMSLGVPAEHLVSALDRVALVCGIDHKAPNWHHHSIWDRMQFLKRASREPLVVVRHNRFCRRLVSSFIVILVFLGAALLTNDTVPKGLETTGAVISEKVNASLRYKVARHTRKQLGLLGDPKRLDPILAKSLTKESATSVPGLYEFYAAQLLLSDEQTIASGQMMLLAWSRFDFGLLNDGASSEVKLEFRRVSEAIRHALENETSLKNELRHAERE